MPLVQTNGLGGLDNGLVNPWSRNRMTKRGHAGYGPELSQRSRFQWRTEDMYYIALYVLKALVKTYQLR